MSKRTTWTTYDEINHINKLGLKSKNGRLQALKNYKKGLSRRTNFGELDKEILIKYVNEEIRMEEGR